MKLRIWTLVVLAALGSALRASAQTFPIDPQRSTITVHVFKAGLFSVFAHDHQIRAPLVSGSITVAPDAAVEFLVRVGEMLVLDPELDADKRADVQATMLGPKVLDAERYPEIRFRSTAATEPEPGRWRVAGELSLHGQTRPVEVMAERGKEGLYRATARLNQRDYGIQPVSLAGGTIKIKDEIRIDFELAAPAPTLPTSGRTP